MQHIDSIFWHRLFHGVFWLQEFQDFVQKAFSSSTYIVLFFCCISSVPDPNMLPAVPDVRLQQLPRTCGRVLLPCICFFWRRMVVHIV